ncbi:MAG: hypothetical protein MUE49_13455 [Rhodospirillales bacterium]|jgi:hypothetical protein|nr:hypothetical protein [Rhodospirillales bacterium]
MTTVSRRPKQLSHDFNTLPVGAGRKLTTFDDIVTTARTTFDDTADDIADDSGRPPVAAAV